jgi:hypothetical protein
MAARYPRGLIFEQDISSLDRYGNDDSSKFRGEIDRIDPAIRGRG